MEEITMAEQISKGYGSYKMQQLLYSSVRKNQIGEYKLLKHNVWVSSFDYGSSIYTFFIC